MLDLFPDSAAVDGADLKIGGLTAAELVRAHGTPLVVIDAATVRAQAQAYRAAAPGAWIAYGTKAFPNVALLKLLAEEGVGADVSTLGELRFAQAAKVDPAAIVVHGNNKSDAELEAAAEAELLVVLDSLEEIERARDAGVTRTLIRVTPGIDADTHEAVRTAHHGSKFGLPPADALEALKRSPDILGLHVHIGSQLLDPSAGIATAEWLGGFAAQAFEKVGWEAKVIDLGGGLGVATAPGEPQPDVGSFVTKLLAAFSKAWEGHGLAEPQLILEPGRSLVARAGVTLYSVGTVKTVADGTTFVAVDGGMSDNPRPALYGSRYTALLADRAGEKTSGTFAIAGKHCESGDVLIEEVKLPRPERGDILAVPATGGYTLSMSSNYNALPRPAVVLVENGKAKVIRRRETVDDLLAPES